MPHIRITSIVSMVFLLAVTLSGCTEIDRLSGALGFGNPDPKTSQQDVVARVSRRCCWCITRDNNTNVLTQYFGKSACEEKTASNEFKTCEMVEAFTPDCNLVKVFIKRTHSQCFPTAIEYKKANGAVGFIDPPDESETLCGRELALQTTILQQRGNNPSVSAGGQYVEQDAYCTCQPHPQDATRCIAIRWAGADREELGTVKLNTGVYSYCTAEACQSAFKIGGMICGSWRNF